MFYMDASEIEVYCQFMAISKEEMPINHRIIALPVTITTGELDHTAPLVPRHSELQR